MGRAFKYKTNCPFCKKLEIVKTTKTRHPQKHVCKGCGKEYVVPVNDIRFILENEVK